jgi:hypothetical protein
VLGLYRKFNYIFEKFKLIVIRCNLQNTGYMVFCYKDIRAPKSDSNEFENIMLKESIFTNVKISANHKLNIQKKTNWFFGKIKINFNT